MWDMAGPLRAFLWLVAIVVVTLVALLVWRW